MSEKEYFDWDDTIENDGQEFILLPEGDYVFRVMDVERGWQNSTAKIPKGCNKAVLTLEVETPKGPARITTNMLLLGSMEWKLSAFFRSVGLKKHGEKLKMEWNKVPGRKGLAHIKPRSYTTNDGQERQTNDLDRWLDYDPEKINAESGKRNAEFDEDIPF